MGIGVNGGGGGGGAGDVSPESPWNTYATAYPVKDADSDSWSAFSEAKQRPKISANMCYDSVKSPPPQQAVGDGCDAAQVVPCVVGCILFVNYFLSLFDSRDCRV